MRKMKDHYNNDHSLSKRSAGPPPAEYELAKRRTPLSGPQTRIMPPTPDLVEESMAVNVPYTVGRRE
jgi:hypothetical protein